MRDVQWSNRVFFYGHNTIEDDNDNYELKINNNEDKQGFIANQGSVSADPTITQPAAVTPRATTRSGSN